MWLALWSGVLVLVVVPILALRRRGRPWAPCLLAGMGSGALGLVLIGLDGTRPLTRRAARSGADAASAASR